MKKVILSLTGNNKEIVIQFNKSKLSAEKLKNLDFKYSVQPEKEAIDIHNELVSGVISAVNEEPISATLETFGDIDKAITEADKSKHLGRPSTEQGGNRVKSSYNIDRDPFNE